MVLEKPLNKVITYVIMKTRNLYHLVLRLIDLGEMDEFWLSVVYRSASHCFFVAT